MFGIRSSASCLGEKQFLLKNKSVNVLTHGVFYVAVMLGSWFSWSKLLVVSLSSQPGFFPLSVPTCSVPHRGKLIELSKDAHISHHVRSEGDLRKRRVGIFKKKLRNKIHKLIDKLSNTAQGSGLSAVIICWSSRILKNQ